MKGSVNAMRVRTCNSFIISQGEFGEEKKAKQRKKCKESAKIRLSQYKAMSFSNEIEEQFYDLARNDLRMQGRPLFIVYV